ncbi:hypothetical protein LUZ62_039142 [Rhynchospora pubera]|uniref:Uncharacterized protein n=1 Tax=Rhynchospora pubera TaxID=906938 RepID=A0AAV8F893_9POAL|nr:hypothetical protein LUZ62_039142 [Rhynchospora pubera]
MAGITSQVCNSIQSYWRRRYYQRLEPLSKPVKVARLGTGRRTWKPRPVQPMFKIRAKIWSPRKLLSKARDAYVNLMLALAGGEDRPVASLKNSRSVSDGLWARRMPKARPMSVSGQKEFERRMMLHIYNILVARPELPGAPKMVTVAA